MIRIVVKKLIIALRPAVWVVKSLRNFRITIFSVNAVLKEEYEYQSVW
jgi:hypothetical protein